MKEETYIDSGGPAIIYSDGTEFYYLEDIEVSRRDLDLLWLKKQIQS